MTCLESRCRVVRLKRETTGEASLVMCRMFRGKRGDRNRKDSMAAPGQDDEGRKGRHLHTKESVVRCCLALLRATSPVRLGSRWPGFEGSPASAMQRFYDGHKEDTIDSPA